MRQDQDYNCLNWLMNSMSNIVWGLRYSNLVQCSRKSWFICNTFLKLYHVPKSNSDISHCQRQHFHLYVICKWEYSLTSPVKCSMLNEWVSELMRVTLATSGGRVKVCLWQYPIPMFCFVGFFRVYVLTFVVPFNCRVSAYRWCCIFLFHIQNMANIVSIGFCGWMYRAVKSITVWQIKIGSLYYLI